MRSFITAAAALAAGVAAQSLPQVDLGYEIHRAASYNSIDKSYAFNNIRFAQPPVGNLRFAAPVPPTGRNTTVQDGTGFNPVCPQAAPAWLAVGALFVAAFDAGNQSSFNYTAAVAQATAAEALAPPYMPGPDETEDCLFLDVKVPKAVFDNANNMRRKRTGEGGAPVMIWIYGGGYTLGSKNQSNAYDPVGLLNASMAAGGSGMIYVAINYRLGAMGWLAGPTVQSEGGVSNAGLYDQRLAIEWVKNNIALFGGNPNEITLVGESAGGGSIMHQITAYAGQRNVSFQRAVPQSPGWFPISSPARQENDTLGFFQNLGVSSLAEARAANSSAVITANYKTVAAALYGQFYFGPVVDGIFVTTQPGLALLDSQAYPHNLQIMPGHNTNEGPLFTPPYVTTNDQLSAYLSTNYPGATSAAINYIVNVLYPPIYDGSQPYRTAIDRSILITTESIFTCNTDYLARAYNNQTYNYQFEVYPATHGQDVASTFYVGEGTNLTLGVYAPVAQAMQTYITNFVMTGNPNTPSLQSAGPLLPYFPMQGNNATEMGLNFTVNAQGIVPAIGVQVDPTVNARCRWWQKGLYL